MIHLGETASSFMQVVLVAGLALLIPILADKERTLHRAILLATASALALRYLWWRATETVAPLGLTWDWAASWSLLALETLSVIGSISAFTMLARTRRRSAEASANLGWWGAAPEPRVAILIATYNEDREVLERTILGSLGLRHASKTIHVLDDGKRDWLRDYCARRGVDYVRRPDNRDAKAGNINHALDAMAADPPDFVVVLDADFVPHRGFLSRTLALFHDPTVGLVQTPQHFFNADPIQHNLNLSRSYPDEQRFFFDTMEPCRDAWDIAFCCGTSSIARWEALRAIGGFPTESVTEDFMLTVVLQSAGWRTVYLDEALTEGLAPEGLKEYVTQRARWCLGMMQIARSKVGPFSRAPIRLRDRWSVLDAGAYWLTTFPFRIAALVFPLLYWYFDILVVDARVPDVISHFGVYYLWTLVALNHLSRGNVVPVINDVSQLVGAFQISRAALVGLFRPHGHPFTVTAKGGDRSRIQVQWHMMAPFAALLALTLVGLGLGIVSDRFAFFDAGDGKAVVLFWTIYNVAVLALTVVVCIELPRAERHVADAPERAELIHGRPRPVWISELTTQGTRVDGAEIPKGEQVSIRIAEVGEVAATSLGYRTSGTTLLFHCTSEQLDALQLKLYAEDNMPGIAGARLGSLVRDLGRKLAFTR
ncbi:glycosyltransferase [Jannaschia sp. W003]|uniref:glycosyltransferase n=1 Tax=Jannaschia sp. W003 TaxID=2867012 RepID=UPI0021A6F1B6|nr:glycosyltransferase [Jannaschia sp. W003]UWQ23160.1 glycosyltransferase [Jannaschia sp. W003]